jgi:hypothetical protein
MEILRQFAEPYILGKRESLKLEFPARFWGFATAEWAVADHQVPFIAHAVPMNEMIFVEFWVEADWRVRVTRLPL